MQHQFEGLKVWQEAIKLAKDVYEITKTLPKEELYGMTSQLRRAAVSISSNVAEGKGRYHKKEYIQFLYIARGSVYETISLIHLSLSLEYLTSKQSQLLLEHLSQIAAMLNGLIQSLQ